jgi:hypothetical protein
MSLTLGRSFDRSYSLRVPLLNSFFNIGIFFNSRSPFLLFRVDNNSSEGNYESKINSYKINTFKNIQSSLFCETFLDLYSFRNNSLDIINQFNNIKDYFKDDVNLIINENIILSKIIYNNSTFYDQLIIYGFTLTLYDNQYLFILTERQNIISKLKRKVVRTSGLQIASSDALSIISEYRKNNRRKN